MRVTPKMEAVFDAEERFYMGDNWETKKTLTNRKALELCESGKARGLFGMSKVNKSLTKQQAYDILSKGLAEKNPDDKVHFLAARNIVKEFA